ncbi:hypothetical protein ACV22X_22075 [Burkholderia orbicola]
MNQTKRVQILNMIRSRPGIREPEIREDIEITGAVSAYIKPDIDRGNVLVEKVALETGGSVSAFRENAVKPLEIDAHGNVSDRRRARATSQESVAGPTTVDISVSAAGVTTITKGGKSMSLTASETDRIVSYLDRINIDQILADAGL